MKDFLHMDFDESGVGNDGEDYRSELNFENDD
jgi:hypothetical protein